MAIPDPGDLTSYLDETGAAFLSGSDGFVALGEVARLDGATMEEADSWWSDFVATVENETEMPGTFGTGPLAYASFVYNSQRSEMGSAMIVPQTIIGRRDGVSWITQIGYDRVQPELPDRQPPPHAPGDMHFEDGAISGADWLSTVAHTSDRLDKGDAERVVMTRDLLAVAHDPISMPWILEQWHRNYGASTCYLVDGLVGATYEVMVRRKGGLCLSRILAGSVERIGSVDDAVLISRLLTSPERLRQHRLAVEAATNGLGPHMRGIHVPDEPYVASLLDNFSLTTDICGVAQPDHSTLALAAAMHPLAALTGSPMDQARTIIDQDEDLDRGRFSGPVGWIDAQGDGEWFAALRAAQIQPDHTSLRLYASASISPTTTPHNTLVSTEMKFAQMRSILNPVSAS